MQIFKYGQKELEYLKEREKILGSAIERIGTVEREVIPDPFAALVNIIASQQISSKAAATVRNRMLEYFGRITPQIIASTTVEDLHKCGLSMRKAGYIKGVAEAEMQGELNLSEFPEQSDGEIIRRLSSLKGIGTWTAEMFLIFSMERPDVVSWNDLAIRRGMMKLYGLQTLTREQFDEYRKRYSPYGSVASLYLWKLSLER
ncbi:MAG: DNA-3-methyladenine glycosylase [Methanolobus sp.]|nr:DNA-3-methyladenine glycosylase [Methanolobus sp.]